MDSHNRQSSHWEPAAEYQQITPHSGIVRSSVDGSIVRIDHLNSDPPSTAGSLSVEEIRNIFSSLSKPDRPALIETLCIVWNHRPAETADLREIIDKVIGQETSSRCMRICIASDPKDEGYIADRLRSADRIPGIVQCLHYDRKLRYRFISALLASVDLPAKTAEFAFGHSVSSPGQPSRNTISVGQLYNVLLLASAGKRSLLLRGYPSGWGASQCSINGEVEIVSKSYLAEMKADHSGAQGPEVNLYAMSDSRLVANHESLLGKNVQSLLLKDKSRLIERLSALDDRDIRRLFSASQDVRLTMQRCSYGRIASREDILRLGSSPRIADMNKGIDLGRIFHGVQPARSVRQPAVTFTAPFGGESIAIEGTGMLPPCFPGESGPERLPALIAGTFSDDACFGIMPSDLYKVSFGRHSDNLSKLVGAVIETRMEDILIATVMLVPALPAQSPKMQIWSRLLINLGRLPWDELQNILESCARKGISGYIDELGQTPLGKAAQGRELIGEIYRAISRPSWWIPRSLRVRNEPLAAYRYISESLVQFGLLVGHWPALWDAARVRIAGELDVYED